MIIDRNSGSVETNEVAYWITQRELIRHRKLAGEPRPWTDDPILREYRFCNVHREDDTTTQWIAKNWRNPYADHPMLIRAMLLARMVNWPPTLAEIGFPHPWHPDKIVKIINACAKRGKAWGSAYIVSTNGRAIQKALYVVYEVCGRVGATLPCHGTPVTLQNVYRGLLGYNGVGSFMAGQLIADLKNTPGHVLQGAPDWWTWACEGPGSKRGLMRYFKSRSPTAELAFTGFLNALHVMIREVAPLLPGSIDKLCAQDWQNVMCEMGKYWRTKDGRGRPKARYTPNPPFP